MEDLFTLWNNLTHSTHFNNIYIALASPEKIRSWSYGEVKTAETINYRTFKPEHQGLFCARTFGPIKDYECSCGKYKLFKHQGVVCEKCGVEVTRTSVRRERMGHIELATPIAHIWYFKSLPSRIGLLLDISLRDLERVLYFDAYIVIDPGFTSLKQSQLLSETEYLEALEAHGNEFDARMGGEAIYELLKVFDLVNEEDKLHEQINITHSETLLKKLRKRLRLIQTFLHSDNRAEWMVLTVLPVLPPDLRPLVPIDGGRFATSDLNDLYRRVINRNNRTKRLIELKAPEVIVRNEMRMLQESVDALLDNGRRGKAFLGMNKQPLHSLSEMIKGKQGRFRQNLLGKRVDYSGRTVIVVGPSLKLHQCGLPKNMALELFKPFVYNLILKKEQAISITAAKQMVDQQLPIVWKILEEVVSEHPVLLNRPPTLYRLGLQAFEPVLIEGNAIQLHPLVCKAFNANFDGDQMAVHIPLSIEAQLEARVLMMSNCNILSPVNGEPLIVPTQDMLIGLLLMTRSREGARGQGMKLADINEVERAYENKVVELQASIEVRIKEIKPSTGRSKKSQIKTFKTTVGRALLSRILPEALPFESINHCLTKERLSDLINQCYYQCGIKETISFAQKLMELGFSYATRSGFSLNIEEMPIPSQKSELIQEAFTAIDEVYEQYKMGMITNSQRYNQVIDIWSKTNEKMAQAVLNQLSDNTRKPRSVSKQSKNKSVKTTENENVLYLMIEAGIRNLMQIRQLAGMRGLMTKQDGSILETPITANLREGLDSFEYFISTHGTRKGLADTALRTANAGYLTRRLVDVAQDVIIIEQDCKTTESITITALYDKDEQLIESLTERILGRVLAENIVMTPRSKKPVFKAGTLLDENSVKHIEELGIKQVKIRSPITCKSRYGICAKCYGRDLARGQSVNLYEAIGIMAAQSIGEAGTQLTMRTHRAGGVAKRAAPVNQIRANAKGIVKLHDFKVIQHSKESKSKGKSSRLGSEHIVISHSNALSILDKRSGKESEQHKVPYGAILKVNDGDTVEIGQQIASWDPHSYPIISEVAGYIRLINVIEGVTVNREVDKHTGIVTITVKEPKQRPIHAKDLRPLVKIVDKEGDELKLTDSEQITTYLIPPYAIINVEEGKKVNLGDVIARLPEEPPKTRDITNGLLRVADLFEARIPKEPAILALRSGVVSFGKETKTKHRFIITGEAGQQEEFPIPKWRPINASVGQKVDLGDVIVEGLPNLHDILHLKGMNELVKYMLNEMQAIYVSHGVKINDKHFEVIIRQMLRTVTIIEPGDTSFLSGDVVLFTRLLEENQAISTQAPRSGRLATWEQNLLGITKSSLATDSFLSAASFIDSARVLLNSSINGKADKLRGLKENVIIGRLIPAGTGSNYSEK
jgi:DNA-directed RNA polymerase subunit beta'